MFTAYRIHSTDRKLILNQEKLDHELALYDILWNT